MRWFAQAASRVKQKLCSQQVLALLALLVRWVHQVLWVLLALMAQLVLPDLKA
jgi:hypothetical protein